MSGASSDEQKHNAASLERLERAGARTRRLFLALWPDDRQQTVLAHAARKAVKANGGRAMPAANLHITLVFLGSVVEADIPRLMAIAADVAASCPSGSAPLQMSFERLEHWHTPQVLCAIPTQQPVCAVDELAEALRIQLVAAGFTPDLKPFRAHVTLARKVQRLQGALTIERSRWRCADFSLIESQRTAGGALYSVVQSWLLARPRMT